MNNQNNKLGRFYRT